MASARRSWRVVGVAGAAAIGCLDANPKFVESSAGTGDASTGSPGTGGPTTGGPTSGPTTSMTSVTTLPPPTTGPTSETGDTTGESTGSLTSGPMSTLDPGVCGDGAVDPGEQCDDGPANADDAACKSDCTNAVCGDALVAIGIEECDAGVNNGDDQPCKADCTEAFCGDGLINVQMEDCDDQNMLADDGCVECSIPATCKDIVAAAPDPMQLKTGKHMIDPDGGGPNPLIPVWCDMTTDGGGWTLIERSPRINPIGKPLFEDAMINAGMPEAQQYRMPQMVIMLVAQPPSDLRIDCGGGIDGDYLLTDAMSLVLGQFGPKDCGHYETVLYKEAQLKMNKVFNAEICTGIMGKAQMCDGAWRIEEAVQQPCQLNPFPWMGEMLSPDGADLFAVDAAQIDPGHSCHMPGAVREIKLR